MEHILERALKKKLRLDRATIEVEYHASPYQGELSKEPAPNSRDKGEEHTDDWRWSVSAAKKFLNKITVSGKIASDHLLMADENGWFFSREKLLRSDEWYWRIGLSVGF